MTYIRQTFVKNIKFNFSQGEEWYKLRTVTAPKMLKMKEALDFCIPMSDVGNDFVDRLKTMRKNNNEIVGLEKELFKWAFECKLIKLHTFNMFNT